VPKSVGNGTSRANQNASTFGMTRQQIAIRP
jgi:hypothetical protein